MDHETIFWMILFWITVSALCGVTYLYIFTPPTGVEGFFAENSCEPEARGDWICVDVEHLTPKRALEVCQHEVGHEVFAEFCEDNIEDCINYAQEKQTFK